MRASNVPVPIYFEKNVASTAGVAGHRALSLLLCTAHIRKAQTLLTLQSNSCPSRKHYKEAPPPFSPRIEGLQLPHPTNLLIRGENFTCNPPQRPSTCCLHERFSRWSVILFNQLHSLILFQYLQQSVQFVLKGAKLNLRSGDQRHTQTRRSLSFTDVPRSETLEPSEWAAIRPRRMIKQQ